MVFSKGNIWYVAFVISVVMEVMKNQFKCFWHEDVFILYLYEIWCWLYVFCTMSICICNSDLHVILSLQMHDQYDFFTLVPAGNNNLGT